MTENPFLETIKRTLSSPIPPLVIIPFFSERKDQGNSWEEFWQSLLSEAIIKTEDQKVITTFNVSPHTPLKFTFDKSEKPAHLLVWAKNYDVNNTETPGIAALDQKDIQALSLQIAQAVDILNNINDDKDKIILIYSLQGYSEKSNLLFSSGSQTNPFFHTHVVSVPTNIAESENNKESPDFRERIKYYGFFNSIIFDLFKQLTREFLKSKEKVCLQLDEDNFYLRLKFDSEEKNNLADYFSLLKELGIFFDSFYQGLIEYYKSSVLGDFRLSGNIDELKRILKQRLNLEFSDDFYQKILEIISFIRPSNNLINSLINEENDESKKIILRRLLERNKKIRDSLSNQRFKNRLKKFFNLSDDELNGFISFLNDVFSSNKPIFGFPQHFPWVFLIDDFDFVNYNGEKSLEIKQGVKIRPMFLTVGGNTAERIVNAVIRRI